MTDGSHDPPSHGPREDGLTDNFTDGLTDNFTDGLLSGLPPVLSPGRAHLLWDNGNGTAAVWRLGVPGFEGEADRRQFGPYAGWAVRALAVGPDGRVFLLWAGPDRAASVWSVDMEEGAARHREFGPYAGWAARALAVGPDGVLRVLWAGAGGAAALWSVPEESFREGTAPGALDCGPFAAWTARALAVGQDDLAHLLWTRGDGAASVWRIGADGRAESSEYGPYGGWGAVGVAPGPGGVSRLLWRGAGGAASLWDMGVRGVGDGGEEDALAPDERPQVVHGPFKGWTPEAVARGPDDAAHLLWRHTGGGLASVWRLGGAGGGSHAEHGPYVGWTPVALAVGP